MTVALVWIGSHLTAVWLSVWTVLLGVAGVVQCVT